MQSNSTLSQKARNATSNTSSAECAGNVIELGCTLKSHCRKFHSPRQPSIPKQASKRRLPVDCASWPHKANALKMFAELNGGFGSI